MTESERERWEKGDRVKESEEGRIGEIKRSTERERRRRTEQLSCCYNRESVRSSRGEPLPRGLLPCVSPRQQPTGPEVRWSVQEEPTSKAAGS